MQEEGFLLDDQQSLRTFKATPNNSNIPAHLTNKASSGDSSAADAVEILHQFIDGDIRDDQYQQVYFRKNMETGEVEEMNDFDCINEVYEYNNEEEEAQQELSNIEEEQPMPVSPKREDEDV